MILEVYIFDPICEQPVIFVGSIPLAEYAAEADLDELSVGPDASDVDE